jgi:hypothetical protein
MAWHLAGTGTKTEFNRIHLCAAFMQWPMGKTQERDTCYIGLTMPLAV